MSEPMVIYDGRVAIGAIVERSPGKIVALKIDANGERTSLGSYPTRRAAMQAISARHDGGPEPPRAA